MSQDVEGIGGVAQLPNKKKMGRGVAMESEMDVKKDMCGKRSWVVGKKNVIEIEGGAGQSEGVAQQKSEMQLGWVLAERVARRHSKKTPRYVGD